MGILEMQTKLSTNCTNKLKIENECCKHFTLLYFLKIVQIIPFDVIRLTDARH